MISRFAAYALTIAMFFATIGCGGGKPVTTEEEGLQGMQDMDPGAAPAR